MRAKFYVAGVSNDNHGENGAKSGESVSLSPVIAADGNNENTSFSNATPSGQLNMHISNPEAWGFFEQGKEYYIDFTAAPAAEAAAEGGE